MSGNVRPQPSTPDPSGSAGPVDMAIDTVAAILRSLGDYALDQDDMEASAFRTLCERWAQHVTLATPPPGGASAGGGPKEARRDWIGVRELVRAYCRGSSTRARNVTTDLRQVVWVFIQHLAHAVAREKQTDARIKEQLGRLEQLAMGGATGDLKREVLSTVLAVSQVLDQRRAREAEETLSIGARVQSLGSELHDVRREGGTDALTRLFDRKAFDAYAADTVELGRAFGRDTCLMLVDVDRMKTMNEAFGRNTGDAILCRLADGITRTFFRKSDFVARRGSDEIAIILRETARKEGLTLAERVLRVARAIEIEREGPRIRMSVSVGLVGLDLGEERQAWIDRAERALARAQREGGDRVAEG